MIHRVDDKEIGTRKSSLSIEDLIGLVLRAGVSLSAAFIVLGMVMYVMDAKKALGIITLGLLVLISTPIVRVSVSILAFIKERNWRFAAVTIVVLAIVIAGVALGYVE